MMDSQRGQVSILIAILFQVLFVFFAMVINVGLLIHDKINLQNSVDIAAYYAAMKQAEVLNTMAHVNYQIRQAWKLLNWRLWSLGDAGRNRSFAYYMEGLATGNQTVSEGPPLWTSPSPYQGPTVCLHNHFWYEANINPATNTPRPSGDIQNMCRKSNLIAPSFRALQLTPVQQVFGFMQIFQQQSRNFVQRFGRGCDDAGTDNALLAGRFLQSYKMTVQNKRRIMQMIQKFLTQDAGDFRDIANDSVRSGVNKVINKNLTLANRAGLNEIEFHHSFNVQGQPMPFLVPIDVRLFVWYVDLFSPNNNPNETSCMAQPKELNELPKRYSSQDPGERQLLDWGKMLADVDDSALQRPVSAANFALEEITPNSAIPSLVGFEKDPWMMAYVHVKATATARMLFAPTGGVVLEAEAYAMPFGGKLGPWYMSQWQPTELYSTDGNKVDPLLPKRNTDTSGTNNVVPNYSRFPGDIYGASSDLARVVGLKAAWSPNQFDLPQFLRDDYANILSGGSTVFEDPIVYRQSNPGAKIRIAEISAIAPNVFDTTYYSINNNFYDTIKNSPLFDVVCREQKWLCTDFGSTLRNGNVQTFNVSQQIEAYKTDPILANDSFWLLRSPDHLNTSWSQYLKRPDVFNDYSGIAKSQDKGGRSGYSVKIVSKKFLDRSDLPLGGGSVRGPLKNAPSRLGL